MGIHQTNGFSLVSLAIKETHICIILFTLFFPTLTSRNENVEFF
jgi:hypothetical protein